MLLEICYSGTSLVIQWLRLHSSTAGSWIQFLVGELRSHMLCCMAKKEEEEEKKYIVHLVFTTFFYLQCVIYNFVMLQNHTVFVKIWEYKYLYKC